MVVLGFNCTVLTYYYHSGQGKSYSHAMYYGATFIAVNHCLAKGIIPVYSTTHRIVREEKNEDKVISVREFEHVILRKYEN